MENRSFRKSLAVGVIILFFGINVIPDVIGDNPSFVNTIYVDDDAVPPYDGTLEHPYPSIQDGIDNAFDGDTVFVYSGTYYENVKVNKSIILMGEDKKTTNIDFQKDYFKSIEIKASGTIVKGFTIKRSNSVGGIEISSNNIKITDNIITENLDGIYIPNGINVTISDNIIAYNYWDGISITSNNIKIKDNIIAYNKDHGIEIGGSDNVLQDNQLSSNGGNGIRIHNIENITIGNNVISSNIEAGINLGKFKNGVIYSNTIRKNYYGIYASKIPSVNVDNIIFHNNFVDTKYRHVRDCGDNQWDNGTEGNYWDIFDEPSEGAYDNNNDGIIDLPYYIDGGDNLDRYPLKKPYNYIHYEKPVISITSPPEELIIKGTYSITGTAADDGYIFDVQIKIDDGNWESVTGISNWIYNWDSTTVNKGIHTIYARCNDYEGYSDIAKVTVFTNNTEVVYIDDDFNNMTYGWQIDHFNRILDGIDVISKNGLVYVFNGSYYENVIIEKSLSLIGENKNTTFIEGHTSGDSIKIVADGVTIRNFTLQNCYNNSGVSIFSNDIHVADCIIQGNHRGISAPSEDINFRNVRIENNTIINNNCNCNIPFNGGIRIYSSEKIVIANNVIRNNGRHSILIRGSGADRISNNILEGGYIGLECDSYKNISSNYFLGTKSSAIKCNDGFNFVNKNYIINCGNGISLKGNNNRVFMNNFQDINVAISYGGDSSYNRINENNFIDINNFIKYYDFLGEYSNLYEGNYWNKTRILPKVILELHVFWIISPNPRTPDPGLGIPFVLPTFDMIPAKKPYDIPIPECPR